MQRRLAKYYILTSRTDLKVVHLSNFKFDSAYIMRLNLVLKGGVLSVVGMNAIFHRRAHTGYIRDVAAEQISKSNPLRSDSQRDFPF